MKKLRLLFGLFLSSLVINAQVPNPGFENINPNGSIKNWGDLILMAFAIDSNGVPLDTFILDQAFYFSSNDAHSGSKALEMRNGYWTVSGDKIAGRAKLSANDTDYTFFSSPVGIGQVPQNFSFYYKFLPANNDTAYAWLRLTDSSSNIVAEAEIFISGNHPVYSLISTPIIYSGTIASTPAFMEMGFTTAKPYSEANYGTRLVIDDVSLSYITTGMDKESFSNSIQSFPNPAEKYLILKTGTDLNTYNLSISITDIEGRQIKNFNYRPEKNSIKVDIEPLPSGVYFLKLETGTQVYKGKFVK